MKVFKLFLAMSGFFFCLGFTDNTPKHVKGGNFEGYIFPKEYMMEVPFENMKERFTPTYQDVILVESIVKEQLVVINSSRLNQIGGNPVIHKELRIYKRQYVGYIDTNGDRIVWINFIWKREIPKTWNKDILIVLDGGSYFWNLKVLLNKNKAFDLQVNGLS